MKALFRQTLLPGLPALFLILLGLAAGVLAVGYEVGSFTRMGPGFFPLALGIVLIVLGLLILVRETPDTAVTPPAWRPFLAVATSILAWALLAESAGFVPASLVQILLCSCALSERQWASILILAVVLTTVGYLLFVVQLGVPLNLVG